MRVLMNETRRGSSSGTDVRRYFEGEEYEVSETLGDIFVSEGWAEEVEIEEDPEPEEDTDEDSFEEKEEEEPVSEDGFSGWEGTVGPYDYLKRWPTGPKSDLAVRLLEEAEEDLPEEYVEATTS